VSAGLGLRSNAIAVSGRLLSRSTFRVYSRGTSRTSLGAARGSGDTGIDAAPSIHQPTARTGSAAEALSFEQIARGALAGRRHSLIVCSFAMPLIDASWLPALLSQLASVTPRLLILTPHKRPNIRLDWGWRLGDEILHERVRTRIYAVHAP
jgi:hypothetical protein